jgi:hypothetical protein
MGKESFSRHPLLVMAKIGEIEFICAIRLEPHDFAHRIHECRLAVGRRKLVTLIFSVALQRITRLWRVNQVRFNLVPATRRRSASEREGLSGWRLAQASISAVNAGGGVTIFLFRSPLCFGHALHRWHSNKRWLPSRYADGAAS